MIKANLIRTNLIRVNLIRVKLTDDSVIYEKDPASFGKLTREWLGSLSDEDLEILETELQQKKISDDLLDLSEY
jgi:hypothetical protein